MRELSDEEIRPVAHNIREFLNRIGKTHWPDGREITDEDVWQIAIQKILRREEPI